MKIKVSPGRVMKWNDFGEVCSYPLRRIDVLMYTSVSGETGGVY